VGFYFALCFRYGDGGRQKLGSDDEGLFRRRSRRSSSGDGHGVRSLLFPTAFSVQTKLLLFRPLGLSLSFSFFSSFFFGSLRRMLLLMMLQFGNLVRMFVLFLRKFSLIYPMAITKQLIRSKASKHWSLMSRSLPFRQ
jgi:hypothetical protein